MGTTEIAGTRSEHRVKMNRMRMEIASRLKDAQNTNAMLTTFNELDMSAIMQLKYNQDAFVKKHGIKMGFMSAFVKASAYALTKQPTVNAVIDGQEILYRDYVDISVAVVIRPMMYIALTYDHRLIDGREAVTFLRTIKTAVEDPRVMLMDLRRSAPESPSPKKNFHAKMGSNAASLSSWFHILSALISMSMDVLKKR